MAKSSTLKLSVIPGDLKWNRWSPSPIRPAGPASEGEKTHLQRLLEQRALQPHWAHRSLGPLVKMQILSQQACFSFCISNKLPGDAGTTSLGPGQTEGPQSKAGPVLTPWSWKSSYCKENSSEKYSGTYFPKKCMTLARSTYYHMAN